MSLAIGDVRLTADAGDLAHESLPSGADIVRRGQ
jgi:hypothetical protein